VDVRRAAIIVLVASSAWAAEYRTTLVSADEAEPIHSAVVRKEAWTQESIRLLRANADHRLKDADLRVCLEKFAACDLPNLWKPKADAFYRVENFPLLGTGKLDLRAVKELAAKLAASKA